MTTTTRVRRRRALAAGLDWLAPPNQLTVLHPAGPIAVSPLQTTVHANGRTVILVEAEVGNPDIATGDPVIIDAHGTRHNATIARHATRHNATRFELDIPADT